MLQDPSRDALKAGAAAQKFALTAKGAHTLGPTVNPPWTAVIVDPVAGMMSAPNWFLSPEPPMLRSFTPRESRKLFTVFGTIEMGVASTGVGRPKKRAASPSRLRRERTMDTS